jgi:hypothetical protein
MNQISNGHLVAGNVEAFEVSRAEDGAVSLRLRIGGMAVLASMGPVYASFLAKQLRAAATEIHMEAEAKVD